MLTLSGHLREGREERYPHDRQEEVSSPSGELRYILKQLSPPVSFDV